MRLIFWKKRKRPDLVGVVSDQLSGVGHAATRSRTGKAAMVAGGVAALTAGSAAISSLRRRLQATP